MDKDLIQKVWDGDTSDITEEVIKAYQDCTGSDYTAACHYLETEDDGILFRLGVMFGRENKTKPKTKEKEVKECKNCKFKNNYPKCLTANNVACEDWVKIKLRKR